MGMPKVAIEKPVLTAMLFLAVFILGVISLLRLPVELTQGQSQGIVSVIVRARGGMPPNEVEKQITKFVEESIATVSNVKKMYSSSRESESRVTLEFTPGTDMKFAALEVREKFARVKPLLPTEIEKPVIANYDDSDSAVLIFAFTSNSLSPEDTRELIEHELSPVISRVNGVASIEVYGGRERKILVELDRDKMVAYNIAVERVMDILGQSNVNLLAGNVDKGVLEFAVRSMGAFTSVDELGEMGIQGTRQGSIIPLKEIATIKDAFMEAEDESRLNLEQNVTVYVKKTSQANTIPVVENILGVLEQFHEENKDKLDVILISDKAKLITEALTDVKGSLYIGVVLVVALIYIFMRSWMLALIVFISIPASVIATFIFMAALNISINVMTLSALALAIGILVDSSVVIIENIFSKKEKKHTDVRAILEGSEEVFAPLLASLATTLVVFVPILFIDKKIQIQYSGFSLTIVASLVSSFLVAQMLIPMLMMQWTRGKLKPIEKEKTFFYGVEKAYSWLMRINIKSRYFVLAAVIVLFCFTSAQLAKRSIDLPSTLQENEFSIVVFPLAGARLEANSDAIKKVEELLSKIADIEIFSSTVRKDDVRVFVRLKPRAKRTYSKDEIMDLVDKQGNEMVKEIHDDYSLLVDEGASASEDKKLIVNIFGQDGDELQKLAMEFSNRMGKVEGMTNIVMTDLRKRPEYTLVVDRGRAALYGLTAQKIADSIHAQVRGMRPTKYHEVLSGEEIEVITRLQAIYRQKLDDLKFIHMQTDSGKQIPLGEVANFYPSVGPQTIDRMDKYRYVFVKGDCRGALEKVAEDIRKALADVKLPDEYYWRFGGAYDDLLGSKSQLSMALLLTLFLVYGTMACLFQSYLQPLLIMISVPLATIGIYIALEATKTPLSNQVFIGMIILAGYVVSAAIMLTDRTNHLKSEGLSIQEAVTQAGVDRLRPIVMTTLSTTFGFAPMAIGWGQSSDLWAPLAVTVIGGLLSSTCLTLFVLPNMLIMCRDMSLMVTKINQLFKYLFSLLPKFKTTTGA